MSQLGKIENKSVMIVYVAKHSLLTMNTATI